MSRNQTISRTTPQPILATRFRFSSPPSPTPVHLRRVLWAPLRVSHSPSTRVCVLLIAVRNANTVLYDCRAGGVRNRSSGQVSVDVRMSGVPSRCEENILSEADEESDAEAGVWGAACLDEGATEGRNGRRGPFSSTKCTFSSAELDADAVPTDARRRGLAT